MSDFYDRDYQEENLSKLSDDEFVEAIHKLMINTRYTSKTLPRFMVQRLLRIIDDLARDDSGDRGMGAGVIGMS